MPRRQGSAVRDLGERLGERRGTARGVDVAVAALGPLERFTGLLEAPRGLGGVDRACVDRLSSSVA
jgi:hypothetical protein